MRNKSLSSSSKYETGREKIIQIDLTNNEGVQKIKINGSNISVACQMEESNHKSSENEKEINELKKQINTLGSQLEQMISENQHQNEELQKLIAPISRIIDMWHRQEGTNKNELERIDESKD